MNNLEKYVWKDRRLTADRNEKQIEYKMINLNELQLNVAYNQCKQMLYNQDVKNPGRMAVLDNIQKQLVYCNAELAVRYFKTLKDKDGNLIYNDESLIDDVRSWIRAIENNNEIENKNIVTLGDIIEVPLEFKNIPLPIFYLAVRDMLGIFDHSKISFNFIYRLGIYFTSEELKEMEQKTYGNTLQEKFDVLKHQLLLSDDIELRANPNGLSEQEFRDMIHLKQLKGFSKCKYSELSTNQLKTLRKKVLYNLEDTILKQIDTWKTLMSQIEEVAEYKNYVLH